MKNNSSKLLVLIVLIFTGYTFAQTPVYVDVNPGSEDSYPWGKTAIGEKLFFVYEEPNYDYDYTAAYVDANGTTQKLNYLIPESYELDDFDGGDFPFVNINDNAFWIQWFYDNDLGDYVSFICTESNNDVVLLTADTLYPEQLFTINDELYFNAYGGADVGYELYKMNGTTISLVEDLFPGSGDSQLSIYGTNMNKLYFTFAGYNAQSSESYLFFGEHDGTTLHYDTIIVNGGGYFPAGLVYSNDSVYFAFYGGSMNGTVLHPIVQWANNELLIMPNVLDPNLPPQDVRDMVVANHDVYFTVQNYSNWSTSIYKYDVSVADYDTIAMQTVDDIYEMISMNDTVYFNGNYSGWPMSLCMIAPVNDQIVEIPIPNQLDYVSNLTVVNNELYFRTNVDDPINGETGAEPFKLINGVATMIADINPGDNYSYPYEFVGFLGSVVVTAESSSPSTGEEIVIICNTPVAPTAPQSQIICENEPVSSLTATGTNLTWYATSTGDALDNTTPVTASGTYYVSSTILCPSDRTEVPFTVSMLPNTAAAFLGGSTITVIEPTNSYQWYNCETNQAMTGETNQTLDIPSNGAYYCELTNVDGCSVNTNCIYVINMGTDELTSNAVNVYPNPASTHVTVSATTEMASYTLTSVDGKIGTRESINSQFHQLDVSNYSNGIYILSIYNGNNEMISQHKLVINK